MLNILFAASEAVPFSASGGLADVIGSLPSSIRSKGHDCRVVIPLYKSMHPELRMQLTFLTNITVDVSWRKQYCGIFTAIWQGITYYFIDNEYYFGRDGMYGFYDDCERFVFFDRAVMEMLRYIDFKPSIIHANDWQTALLPVFYEVFYKYQQGYQDIKHIFTIHNIQYQGSYGREVLNEVMGIPLYHMGILEYDGSINMMKGAIETANLITTVSPSYAWEILDPWYSHGLDRILVNKQDKLVGILNGINTEYYNPEKDDILPQKFSANDVSGKSVCKTALLDELGLVDKEKPLVGIITRFVAHKGIDLIRYAFEQLLDLGYQFAILGSGEKIYEDFFAEMHERYPEQVSVTFGFHPDLARKIYAAADMFLMPSQSEPCGLAQMLAMRYGTIPIVRETGGLRDSVNDNGGEGGNGFTFKSYNAHDMFDSCMRAYSCFQDKTEWNGLMKRAMLSDFSWDSSADQYIHLYKKLVDKK